MTLYQNRNVRIRTRYVALAFGIGLLACVIILTRQPSSPKLACPEKPSFEQTTEALRACLDANASTEDVERLLQAWGRMAPDWGGVSQANVLPGRGQEIIIRYHADLESVKWDPQGKLIVMQRDAKHWRAVFDASDIEVENWDNWRYDIIQATDATGDGLDDLLVELVHSNGMRTVRSYVILLTAHQNDGPFALRVALLEETTLTHPSLNFVGTGQRKTIRVVVPMYASQTAAITRTFSFDGDSFTLVGEVINPEASTTSATTPDGAQWYAFDTFEGEGGSPLYSPNLGLYRVQGDQVSHFDVPDTIRTLAAAPDGSLYVGAGCGVLRYRANELETLADVSCDHSSFSGAFFPFDIAFAENGDVWVGGIHGLARFDGATWTEYDVRARRILVAPDGSLWTEGWDGSANPPGRCFTHVTGDTWTAYAYVDDLPVSEGLRERIHELRH
jgi:hypothetical protein